MFFTVFFKEHIIAHAKKARLAHAVNRTRLKSEPAMAQGKVDLSGTLPGFGPHVTRLLGDFKMTWEKHGVKENIPKISQDPVDGLSWSIIWPSTT